MTATKPCAALLAIGLLALPAAAESMFLKSKEVTVDGVADMSGGEAAARDAAIKNAQRNAIEEVIGAAITSSFSAEQREKIKNNQATFESNVNDRIYSKSSGFIESQKLVSEKKGGETYRVTMKIVVKAASLNEELVKLQSIFEKANYPKVMLILNERYTDKSGAQKWIDRPTAVPIIENKLLELGFELVAKDQADKLRAQGLEIYNDMVGTPEKAAEIAAQFGAEVVVTGTSEVKYTSYNELNNKMYYLSALINLRAVNASSAKILASYEAVGRGVGANEALARVAAVKKAGPEVVSNLVGSLVRAWESEAKQGKRFVVVVLKVKNYKRHARPLLKAMKELPNVEAVKELNYGGKRLEMEIIYRGDKSSLLDGIFDEIASQKKFRKLDKVMDRGNTIELSL